MFVFLLAAAAYISVSAILTVVFKEQYRRGSSPKMPKHQLVYYLLSFTWGLPMTIVGLLVAAALRLTGHKPYILGRNIFFGLNVNWGVSLGIVCIVPKICAYPMVLHELGHSIQNATLGLFMPAVVAIPSFVRFVYRSVHKNNKTEYEAIWFEASASAAGRTFDIEIKNY